MKRQFFTLFIALMAVINGMSQMTYTTGGFLSYERAPHADFKTTWGGWAHYWGSTDNIGIKMHIHAADPRMSTTTNKLVFMDSDRQMYIDLYCRTMYQNSDEKLKTDIRPLRSVKPVQRVRAINTVSTSSNSISDMVLSLNPVKFHWKDETEYEKYNIRPVKTGVEEYGFLAQELENIIPGAVAMTDEGDKLVNYSALIPVLTGAIQELIERIEALEARLEVAEANK